MVEAAKVMLNKLGIREFARSNLEIETGEEYHWDFSVMDDTRRLANIETYPPLVSSRRVAGPVIVFFKRLFRKFLYIFLRWFIDPIIDQQTAFNNCLLDVYQSQMEVCQAKINYLRQLVAAQKEELDYLLHKSNIYIDLDLIKNSAIDYMDFENKFRGPRADIKAQQTAFLRYFDLRGGGDVLDIGCGRGEFLELMSDNGIPAFGVDSYLPFVKFCADRGFRVHQADALEFLLGVKDCSLGGIFMSQVVEHLSPDYVVVLIRTAYKKLKPGTHFVIITPNPQSIATYVDFYLDTSHIKPVHYQSLEYLFESSDYQHIERYNPPESLYRERAKPVNGGLNDQKNVEIINEHIFSYRDYAIIARK